MAEHEKAASARRDAELAAAARRPASAEMQVSTCVPRLYCLLMLPYVLGEHHHMHIAVPFNPEVYHLIFDCLQFRSIIKKQISVSGCSWRRGRWWSSAAGWRRWRRSRSAGGRRPPRRRPRRKTWPARCALPSQTTTSKDCVYGESWTRLTTGNGEHSPCGCNPLLSCMTPGWNPMHRSDLHAPAPQLATRRAKLDSLQRESRQACDAAESALRELAQRTAEADALRCAPRCLRPPWTAMHSRPGCILATECQRLRCCNWTVCPLSIQTDIHLISLVLPHQDLALHG